MQALDSVLKRVSARRYDDDFVDRANYLYTPAMLAAFSLTIAAKQYVGKPIQCWTPAQFKGPWEEYSENYCFVENTYYVSMTEQFPREASERRSREIQYYQWVPFILALQILLLILPKTVWNAFNWKSGMNINALSQAARATKKSDKGPVLKDEKEAGQGVEAAKYLNRVLQYQETRRQCRQTVDPEAAVCTVTSKLMPTSGKSYVTVIYLLFKVLNLAICILQLYGLNNFLGPEYTLWGWGILVDLYHERSWQRSGHFPRVTFCDVAVREQGGQLERNTLQCVLMINMFNEKIFIFIWFWLVILIAVNIINLLFWIYNTFSDDRAKSFVRDHMRPLGASEKKKFNLFVEETLGRDGVTCLRLIEHNCGPIAASNIIDGLWKAHDEDKRLFVSKETFSMGSKDNFDYVPKKNWQDGCCSDTPYHHTSQQSYTDASTMPRTTFQAVMREIVEKRPPAVPPRPSAVDPATRYHMPPLESLPRDFTTAATSVNLASMGDSAVNSAANLGTMQADINRLAAQPMSQPTTAQQTAAAADHGSVVMSVSSPATPVVPNNSDSQMQ